MTSGSACTAGMGEPRAGGVASNVEKPRAPARGLPVWADLVGEPWACRMHPLQPPAESGDGGQKGIEVSGEEVCSSELRISYQVTDGRRPTLAVETDKLHGRGDFSF